MAVANLVINSLQQGAVNQYGIRPGWSVQEDATSTDMLDSSGSTGQVSAAFKRIPQAGVGGKPGDAPIKSSTYLLDQTADFLHPELGYIHGNISNVAQSDSTVQIELDSIMNSLNADVTASPFLEGGVFYSFTQTQVPNISTIAVDSGGDLWVGGRDFSIYKFSRFGLVGYIDSFTFATTVKKILIDTTGNLYVIGNLNVYKVDITTRAITTVITAAAGSFSDGVMDGLNNIYLSTTDTTAARAIKKYSTAGTLIAQWGTNNPVLGSATPSVFQSIYGIGVNAAGNRVYVATGTQAGNTYTMDIQYFSATGTYQSTNFISFNTDYNYIFMDWTRSVTTDKVLTVTHDGIASANDAGNSFFINRDFSSPRYASPTPPYGDMAIATDRNGMGTYVGVQNKITRLAGGKMSPYQALECYIGLTGFSGVNNGVLNYTNTTSAQRNVFDGYFPAWSGNAWNYIKQLVSSRKIFLTTSGYKINVTDWTKTVPKINIDNRLGGIQRTENTATAQLINVTNLQSVSSSIIYSAQAGDSVISADYNEINTTTIAVNSYPVSINPLDNVQGTTFPTNTPVYMVSDSSNPPLLLSSGQFVDAGGSVVAAKSSTLGSIDITINGPKVAIPGFTSPFSLAYPSGSQKTPAINVTGNSVVVNPIVLPVLTGASPIVTYQVNAADLSSPFIESGDTAYTVAHEAAVRIGSAEITLDFSIPRKSVHQFGTIAGSYFIYDRLKWRVSSAKVRGDVIDITAKRFTSVGDTTPNPSITVGVHDALWSGFRVQDNFLSPGISTS